MEEKSLLNYLIKRGVTRRILLKFCTAMTATLALPSSFVPQITKALEKE